MFNLNEKEKLTVLDDLFESREESLCALTENDKKKIERLTKNNDSYDNLFNLIENLSNTPQGIEKVRNSLDSYIDKMNIIGAYENEKFYKIRIFRCDKSNFRLQKTIKISVKYRIINYFMI